MDKGIASDVMGNSNGGSHDELGNDIEEDLVDIINGITGNDTWDTEGDAESDVGTALTVTGMCKSC